MSNKNKKNKDDALYYVEVRLVKDDIFYHWEIVNRSKVLFMYRTSKLNSVVIKKHDNIEIIGYYGNEHANKDNFHYYWVSNVDFKLFKKNHTHYEEMLRKGDAGFFRGVVLRRGDYEEFKYLLYGLNEIPEVDKLFNASEKAKKRADILSSSVHNKGITLKRLQDEVNTLNKELEKAQIEANEAREKWVAKIKELGEDYN